nr:hypothetical protein L204_00275 [Cryptococcus depauperatus CBS 7855]
MSPTLLKQSRKRPSSTSSIPSSPTPPVAAAHHLITGLTMTHHHLPASRPSIVLSHRTSPSPRLSLQAHHRPAFLHASTSLGHVNSGETNAKAIDCHDEISNEKVLVYYPPDYQPQSSGAYPYPHQQYILLTQHLPQETPQTTPDEKLSCSGLSALRCGGKPNDGGRLGKVMMWGWVATTLGFFLAIAFWRGQLFHTLDDLSHKLAEQGIYGHFTFFALIFITTIPPLPLYSTLIVLSGYTFGVLQGFIVSYLASLIGAVVVFLVSRRMLKDIIVKRQVNTVLANSAMSMSLLHIIPRHPHILLLIRIAPYPYNLLNVILASSPTLSLQTYTSCTAVSLCKLVLHTWIGSGIHDLSKSYSDHKNLGKGPQAGDMVEGQWPSHSGVSDLVTSEPAPDNDREGVKTWTTWAGIILCVSLFFYLTHIAKRAVKKAQAEQEELEEWEREECQGLTSVVTREDVV